MAAEPLDSQIRSAAEVIRRFGGRYSAELGIDLSAADAREVFKWFLAAVSFAARISGNLPARTYLAFPQEDLVTPKNILERGWDGFVAVLDAGGYVRYDIKTATKLLNVCRNLVERYDGDFGRLHLFERTQGYLGHGAASAERTGPGSGQGTGFPAF